MAKAHAQALRLRLFLEGVEVPIISAQVQCMPHSPAKASIQIPPLAEGTRLHPRTTVHLFFYDLYHVIGEERMNASIDDGRGEKNPTLRERLRKDKNKEVSDSDLRADGWKMLFGGEMVGFAWTKTPVGRSLILQCEDWSNYLDYAYQADNRGIFGPGLKAVFYGASSNLFTDFLETQGSVITWLISAGKCNTFPKLKGLAAGIVRLVEAVGGSYYTFPGQTSPPKKKGGQNVFFSYAELRLHLTQLFGTLQEDPTSERLLRRQGYSGMFNRMLGGQGGMVSIRKAMTALSRVMFYDVYPQPCPKYVPGTYGEVMGVRRVPLKGHPKYGKYAELAEEVTDGLEGVKEDLTSFSFEQPTTTTKKAPTADFFGDTAPEGGDLRSRLRKLGSDVRISLGVARKLLLRARARVRGVPPQVPSAFSSAAKAIGDAITTTRSLGSGQSSGRSSTQPNKLKNISAKIDEAIQQLEQVGEATVVSSSYPDRHPAQLYQQILKPEIWFGAPPRCNVLFPELYDSVSYQRMFLKEPTRFMLKTNDELFGESFLFDKFFFAPRAGSLDGTRATFSKMLRRGLLDHERFTGILPMFEKMGEFNVFASAVSEKRQGIKKIGLAQRSTNFLYFKHRFNARKMNIVGKFNPYVALGFPALIIDKYVDVDTLNRHNELRRQAGRPEITQTEMLGTNFLGNMAQVTHQVSQAQPLGKTDMVLTYPRQSEETSEFLGAIPEELRVRKRIEGADARRTSDVAGIAPFKPYTTGPNEGLVTNVVDVTKDYLSQNGNEVRRLPLHTGITDYDVYQMPSVPIGVAITPRELGSELVEDLIGDKDREVVFKAYRITEEIPRYRREDVLLPAEEFIRPGWYGSTWTNSKIGRAYQELIACGSITDPQSINDLGRSSSQLHTERSQLESDKREDAKNEDDPRADAPVAIELDEGSSIQQAVEFLHLTYSYIKQQGLDVDEFIGAYTWRPIATMLDMFGTYDLTYSKNGERVISGIEGFHSRAVGNYENLFGLVDDEIRSVTGIERGSAASRKLDTRKAKREQVEKYITALLFTTALLG